MFQSKQTIQRQRPVSCYLHAGVGAGEALGVELALVEELEAALPGAVVAAALHRPPADPELLRALVRAVNKPCANTIKNLRQHYA